MEEKFINKAHHLGFILILLKEMSNKPIVKYLYYLLMLYMQ